MRAPKIHIVVGWNQREGGLIAWYFDETDAAAHRDRLNGEQGDDYAYKIESCDAGDPMPEKRSYW